MEWLTDEEKQNIALQSLRDTEGELWAAEINAWAEPDNGQLAAQLTRAQERLAALEAAVDASLPKLRTDMQRKTRRYQSDDERRNFFRQTMRQCASRKLQLAWAVARDPADAGMVRESERFVARLKNLEAALMTAEPELFEGE